MMLRLFAITLISCIALTGSFYAVKRALNPEYVPDTYMNEPLKAGDLIEITGGIECYKYRLNSYHCVKILAGVDQQKL